MSGKQGPAMTSASAFRNDMIPEGGSGAAAATQEPVGGRSIDQEVELKRELISANANTRRAFAVIASLIR